VAWWWNSRASDYRSNSQGFYSWLRHYPGKLFTPTCLCYQESKLVPAKVWK